MMPKKTESLTEVLPAIDLGRQETEPHASTEEPIAGGDEVKAVEMQLYDVKLKFSPTERVDAADKADAWKRYCDKYHILASDWQPEITLVK